MKVIYISGPYRSDGWNGVWENVMRARDVARKLWRKGWVVICPHTNTIFMDGPDLPGETFIRGDLELVRRCDAVFLLPNWERSEGARIEWQHAESLGKDIYQDEKDVPDEEAQ